jgi:hypothetical protein
MRLIRLPRLYKLVRLFRLFKLVKMKNLDKTALAKYLTYFIKMNASKFHF